MLRYGYNISFLLCVSYGIIFVLGILGNGFVLTALVRSPSMRTTTNIFIANLAVADLLVSLFCVPFTLSANLLIEWPFGGTICKIIAYLEAVSISASINSLVAISIDRCLTIKTSFSPISRSKMLRISLIVIWLFPISCMIPWLIVFAAKPAKPGSKLMICTDFWHSKITSDVYFIVVNLVSSYIVPLLLISICYAFIYKKIHYRQIPGELCPTRRRNLQYKSKIKIIKMILVVTITFAISWLPLYVLFCITKFLYIPKSEKEIQTYQFLFPFAQWLGTSNSCINPIIYVCFSKKFRSEFKALIIDNIVKFHKSNESNVVYYSSTTQKCTVISSSNTNSSF